MKAIPAIATALLAAGPALAAQPPPLPVGPPPEHLRLELRPHLPPAPRPPEGPLHPLVTELVRKATGSRAVYTGAVDLGTGAPFHGYRLKSGKAAGALLEDLERALSGMPARKPRIRREGRTLLAVLSGKPAGTLTLVAVEGGHLYASFAPLPAGAAPSREPGAACLETRLRLASLRFVGPGKEATAGEAVEIEGRAELPGDCKGVAAAVEVLVYPDGDRDAARRVRIVETAPGSRRFRGSFTIPAEWRGSGAVKVFHPKSFRGDRLPLGSPP